MKIVTPSVTTLHHTPEPEKAIEWAGRLCWKSSDRVTENSHIHFIRMLKKKDHQSVLEHASAGFHIVTDRGILAELTRHRIASYSVTSTRYVNYGQEKHGGEITVIRPSGIEPDTPQERAWIRGCWAAEESYLTLLSEGVSPQVARSVLPTCLKTEIAVTMNMRSWLHFLELRLSPAAHPDMRIVAGLIRDRLCVIAPTIFEEWNS